jgi:hypothetical protein
MQIHKSFHAAGSEVRLILFGRSPAYVQSVIELVESMKRIEWIP